MKSVPKSPKVIEASAALALGLPEDPLAHELGDKVVSAARRWGKIGLHELCAAACELEGKPFNLFDVDKQDIRAAIRTESLPTILSNLANRVLLNAYSAVGAISDSILAIGTLNDLRVHTRVRLTADGNFERVPPSGQIKSGGVAEGDATYTLTPGTFAKLMVIDREMFYADDLGMVMQLPRILGRTAAVTKERLVMQMILSGVSTFFSAGNKNFMNGGGSALQASSLGTASQKLREQKDSQGNLLLSVPRAIVCPAALEQTALTLYRNTTVDRAAMLNDGGSEFETDVPLARYTPAVASYLGTPGGLTGASDTCWMLIANPADVAFAEIAYLNGQQFPFIERGQVEFSSLSMAFRAVYDFAIGLADPRGAVFSAGA